MSWFSDNLPAVVGGVLAGPVGFIAGNAIDQKDQANNAINGAMVAPGQPGYVDPASLKTNIPDLEARQAGSPGYNALQADATRAPGTTSPYMALQQKQQAQLSNQGVQAGQQTAASGAAAARARLASQGGLTGGASERLARGASQDSLIAGQHARANGANNLAAAGVQDESNRMGEVKSLAGADQDRNNAWASLANSEAQRQNDLTIANQQSKNQVYAANLMSNATLNASRPTGLLGLGFLGL